MTTEDYTRQVLHLVNNKRPTELRRVGMRILGQIKEDIEDLEEQEAIIRKAIELHGAPLPMSADLHTLKPSDTHTTMSQRQTIRQTAIQLAKESPNGEVDIQEITDRLEANGIKLRVEKPNSVVGSIVAYTKGFARVGWKRYKYTEVS